MRRRQMAVLVINNFAGGGTWANDSEQLWSIGLCLRWIENIESFIQWD